MWCQNTKLPKRGWVSGDVKKMGALIVSSEFNPKLSSVNEKLLFKRNTNMAEKTAGFLEKGITCFVIVGAAHIIGYKGIIELLKSKGYTVRQL